MTKYYQHMITMTDKRPHECRWFPIARKNVEWARKKIKEMEQLGVVSKAATQYVNPLVVVEKTNGKLRLCLDARTINSKMENDHAQPPTIDEMLANMEQKRLFSKLDVNQTFWQIPLEKESRQYTGFMFDNQTYVFSRLLKTERSD